MRKNIWFAVAGALVVAIVAAVVWRHALARVAVSSIVSAATGYHLQIGQMHVGAGHGALIDARLSRGGEPVLAAKRIELSYNLRDLLPGSTHRFGLLAVTIDDPQLTIIHHPDGTYNVHLPSNLAAPSKRIDPVPLAFTARIRNGSVELIDEQRYYKNTRRLRIADLNADLDVNSAARTHYVATGAFALGRRQPFRAAGTIDYTRGFAIHRVTAAAVPIKTIGNYFIDSPAAQIVAGTASNFRATIYALGIEPGKPIDYTVSAGTTIADGVFAVHGLRKPLRDLHGQLRIFNGGLAASDVHATAAGVPVQIAGAIFDFAHPQFRVGVTGTGDLAQLRALMPFSQHQPVSGPVALRVLVEGPISEPLLLVHFASPRVEYRAMPFDDARGTVAVRGSTVDIVPFKARYSGIALRVDGALTLGDHLGSELAVAYDGRSEQIPYLGALVDPQRVGGVALLSGVDSALRLRGYVASDSQPQNVHALFALDARGKGEVAPIAVRAHDGGTLVAGYAIDRPHDTSALWFSARDLPVHADGAQFAGIALPALPKISGTLVDAAGAGAGNGRTLALGGRIIASDAAVNGVRFSSIDAQLAGPLRNLALVAVHADGPWGRFDGRAQYAATGLYARGHYSGTLQGLEPFTGQIGARGSVSGPAAIALVGDRVIVQTQNAQLRDASVRGIPLRSVSGTLAVAHGVLRVYAAHAAIAGGDVVAAGTYGGSPHRSTAADALAVVADRLHGGTLTGLGLPLQRGVLSAAGLVSAGSAFPGFDGGVVIRDGSSHGYSFDASANVTLADDSVRIANGIGALGTTYGLVDGSVGALQSGAPRYDVRARVPAGDIASIASTLHLPTYRTVGTFDADLRVRGRGGDPTVNGAFGIPVGMVNGLGFGDASADVFAERGGLVARAGRARIGSTLARFSGTLLGATRAMHVESARADLSDFNDYFDTGDTLGGAGHVDLALSQDARAIYTSGDLDVRNLRYRSLPIGDTQAHWNSERNVVRGVVMVGGPQGMLRASGRIDLHNSHDLRAVVERSRYDVGGTLHDLDLSTWLPALGFPQLAVTGRVNANAQIVGAYPHLSIGGTATMESGTVGPLPVTHAQLTAKAVGSRIHVTGLSFDLPALQAQGSGSFGLSARDPIAFELHAQTNDLRRFIAELTKRSIDVTGSFESTMHVGGTFAKPTFAAALAATDANVYGLAVPQFVGAVAVNGRSLEVRNAEATFARGSAVIAGTLPLQLQPFAIGPRTAPLSLDVAAQALDLAPFSALLGSSHTQLGGQLDGHIGIEGSVADARVVGTLALRGGSYRSDVERQPISNANASIRFTGTGARIETLRANLGRGTLEGGGSLEVVRGAQGSALAYDLHASARSAQLDFPQYGSGTLDAAITLVRRPPKIPTLGGTLTLVDATLPFSAFLRPNAAKPEASPLNVAFDLKIAAGRNVRVRSGGIGAGLDISGQGSAHLGGTLAAPTLDGRFDSTGGTLTYVDHAFRVQSGSVVFDPADGIVPTIAAVGTTRVSNPDPNRTRNPTGSTDITITVNGSLTRPKVEFSSNPPGYTRNELVALLLPFAGFMGPIQFSDSGAIVPPGQLRGAPPAPTGAILPSVAVRRENGTISVGQEAFNIINAQFTAGLLAPLENAVGSALGLSDVNLSLDYAGNFGVNFRRILARDFYAVYGTTLSVPIRQTFGFAYQPSEFTAVQFSYFTQQGPTLLSGAPTAIIQTNVRAAAGQAFTGQSGFTFTFQRLF